MKMVTQSAQQSQSDILLFNSMKRSRAMFQACSSSSADDFSTRQMIRLASKIRREYRKDLAAHSWNGIKPGTHSEEQTPADGTSVSETGDKADSSVTGGTMSTALITPDPSTRQAPAQQSTALLVRKHGAAVSTPAWHAPWKLMRVISGHLGWVRSVAVDPTNEWFATGSADRTIKIWDLASGQLKLTLTGHINAVRGLQISSRHPYLFSAGEDKAVKCWDLEYNKVIRSYHGHLHGVFTLALHPVLDILISGGRDSVARVWDMRSKQQIHVLGGHTDAISSILTQPTDPQVITGSHDRTVKLWDLVAGKSQATLTNHKKAIRALAMHPAEHTFVSAAADNMKKWHAKHGAFIRNFSGHNAIINAVATNQDGVLVSGADNGSMAMWDFSTGYCFQKMQTTVQPGSLDSEAGIFACTFDVTGSRLITCEADKSIKIWKEDDNATPESHPVDMKSWTMESTRRKRY